MIDRDQKHHEEIAQENTNQSNETHSQNADSSSSELSQWKDQFLRVSADFQNFKKRVDRERGEITKYAHISVIEKLLPLIDDLERALTVQVPQNQSSEVKSWVDGLSLIDKKLHKFLSDLSVEEISCSGKFDPYYHEALMDVQAPGKTSGEIVDVLSKGYKIGDTIIRHAKVTVAK